MVLQKILCDLDKCKNLLTADEFQEISKILIVAIKRNFSGDKAAKVEEVKEAVSEISVEEEIKNMQMAEESRKQGTELFKKGDFEGACKKYTEGIEKDPLNKVLYSNRAACYAKLNQDEDGILDAERAIELDLGYAKAYSRLGTFYFYRDPSKSLEYYEKALESDNSNKEYKKMVMELKKRVNNKSKVDFNGENGPMDLDSMLKNPEMMKYAQELLKNKSPEEISQMKEMFQNMMNKKKDMA